MKAIEIKCIKKLLLSVHIGLRIKCHRDEKPAMKVWRQLQNKNIVTIHDYDSVNFNGLYVIKLDSKALLFSSLSGELK